jgi:hypothetical protein
MPHVVLVVIDALRADHVGWYAGADRGTPNLDRLADDGVAFTRAVSQASWTRPAVTSIMTGLYPSQHNLTDRAKSGKQRFSVAALDPSFPTLAERLAAEGFSTAAFAGGNANLRPVFGIIRGFEHIGWRQTTNGEVLADAFQEWLAGDTSSRSFAYVHFMDVHHPLPAEIIPGRLDGGVDLALVEETTKELLDAYAAAVRRVDGHLGRVLDALEAAGRLDDALVIVTADHGEELGERGAVLAHGRTLYPELVHVPFFARLPGAAFAGRVVEGPVQLVDVVPTVLEHLALEPAALPGRSVLPLVRGEEPAGGFAFGELMRRDRYAQSVTTASHQLIKTYVIEDTQSFTGADLSPGMAITVKGQPIQDGPVLATKIGIKEAGGKQKVRAVIDAVDAEARTLTAFGLPFEVAPDAELVGFDGKPLELAELRAGDKASIRFVESDGRRLVQRVARRKTGGKSKIGGEISEVREVADGTRIVTVLGLEVAARDSMPVGAPRVKQAGKMSWTDQLERVLQGDVVDVRTELFDLREDPRATRDVAAEQPHVAQELEGVLAIWTHALANGSSEALESVEVDPETLEQLRKMGYVD